MCGRYASSRQPEDLVEEFEIRQSDLPRLEPDYNVAPTKNVVAVVERHPRDAEGTGHTPSGNEASGESRGEQMTEVVEHDE